MKQLVRSQGFWWGLAMGILAALGIVVAGDLGRGGLPSAPPAGAAEPHPAAASHTLFLAGELPASAQTFVDGHRVEPAAAEGGHLVPVSPEASRLEIRGAQGPLWSTRLGWHAGAVDTLRPSLGGEIVVELGRQARGGALHLDGTLRGSAPGTLADVTPGWHLLSVREGDRVLFEDACVVVSGEVSLVTVPPVPANGKGRLVVRSRVLTGQGFEENAASNVSVNGEPLGTSPLETALPAGFHCVRAEREGFPPSIDVIYVEAGTSRIVTAEFGHQERLMVRAAPPASARPGDPVAVPLVVTLDGGSVEVVSGLLHLVRNGQTEAIDVPLVPSGTDKRLWVAVVPGGVLSEKGVLRGYASCRDSDGREGTSEIFTIHAS